MNKVELNIHITDTLINRYAKVSKDVNPIHLHKNMAKMMGLPNKVAHGMIVMAYSTKFVSSLLLDGWFVSSHDAKLIFPVFLHDTIVIKLNVLQKTDQTCAYKIIGINDSDVKVLQGKIVLQRLHRDNEVK